MELPVYDDMMDCHIPPLSGDAVDTRYLKQYPLEEGGRAVYLAKWLVLLGPNVINACGFPNVCADGRRA